MILTNSLPARWWLLFLLASDGVSHCLNLKASKIFTQFSFRKFQRFTSSLFLQSPKCILRFSFAMQIWILRDFFCLDSPICWTFRKKFFAPELSSSLKFVYWVNKLSWLLRDALHGNVFLFIVTINKLHALANPPTTSLPLALSCFENVFLSLLLFCV